MTTISSVQLNFNSHKSASAMDNFRYNAVLLSVTEQQIRFLHSFLELVTVSNLFRSSVIENNWFNLCLTQSESSSGMPSAEADILLFQYRHAIIRFVNLIKDSSMACMIP